jgi:hypothetical protein
MSDVSKSDFARHLSVSPGRVSQYIKAGMPVRWNGTVNIERAERWIRKHVKRTHNGWMDRGCWQVEFRHDREELAALEAQYGDLDGAEV